MVNIIKEVLLNLAKKYIVWYSRKSGYVTHAKREFEIAWPKEKDDDGMQELMCQQLIELLSVLATHGDSGSSIGYKLHHFQNAANFKIIAPLTFKDDEFNLVDEEEGIWQNKRLSSVFKYSDGTYSYTDGILYMEKYYVGYDAVVVERDCGSFTGGIFVLYPDGHIKCFSNAKIKDITKFNQEPLYIDSYAIEYPKDWWISLCNEDSINKIKEKYFFEIESPDRIKKEINFENGVHRSEILKRIETVGKHMYGESFKGKLARNPTSL